MKRLNFILILCFVVSNSLISQNKMHSYDEINQLSMIDYGVGNHITYQYDEVGNRIGMIVTNNQSNGLSDNISIVGIKLYPNPVSDKLIIEFDGSTSFEILNLMGQVVYNGNLIKSTIVQTTNLPSGVYLIKFVLGKSFEYKKFIKR